MTVTKYRKLSPRNTDLTVALTQAHAKGKNRKIVPFDELIPAKSPAYYLAGKKSKAKVTLPKVILPEIKG